MEEAIQAAEQTARSLDSGHMDLFGGLFAEPEADVYANHRKARELSLKERLKGEKDTLGLYLTGHPIDEYEGEVRRFARQRIVDLRPAREAHRLQYQHAARPMAHHQRAVHLGAQPAGACWHFLSAIGISRSSARPN